jgi:hypothetical protein
MTVKMTSLVVACIAIVAISAQAGGPKKTAETCTKDDDCSRGHCYTKQSGDKVCVDCSSSDIGNYRGQIQRYCKDEPRGCTNIPSTDEAPEDYFKIRIENGERCIAARDGENRACWAGGDSGHRDAVDQAERAKRNCYDELNTRKGNGGIYTCSDSTYSSRISDVNSGCTSYGRACEEWSKDDKVVECNKVEDAMKATSKCIEAVERLDRDCLPRLSRTRESQFGNSKKAYDVCKGILEYKKDKKLCK